MSINKFNQIKWRHDKYFKYLKINSKFITTIRFISLRNIIIFLNVEQDLLFPRVIEFQILKKKDLSEERKCYHCKEDIEH